MFKVYRNGDTTQSDVVEIIIDAEADIESLPTIYGIGSTCIVSENSHVYLLNNQKKWVQI